MPPAAATNKKLGKILSENSRTGIPNSTELVSNFRKILIKGKLFRRMKKLEFGF